MSDGEPSAGPLFSAALRSGGKVELFADRVSDATGSYPLTQIVGALMIVDPATPPLPNGMPAPAVQLRTSDGRMPVFAPTDPSDANRMLEAIFARRPDLRVQAPPPGYASPPPPPGYAPGGYYNAPPGYAPGYQPPVPGFPGGNPDYTLAGLAHLSVFFAPLILPLIVWLTQRDKSPYIARQGKQAFFWHLIFTGGTIVLVIIGYAFFFRSLTSSARFDSPQFPGSFNDSIGIFFVMWGIVLVLSIINIVFGILGAVRAFKGEPFSYPLLRGI